MVDNEERKRAVHEAFERWRDENRRSVESEVRDQSFVTAWAMRAWLADGQRETMGRELDKLQNRIGRQRKANREQLRVLREADERIEELEAALRFYANDEKYELYDGPTAFSNAIERDHGDLARAVLSGGERNGLSAEGMVADLADAIGDDPAEFKAMPIQQAWELLMGYAGAYKNVANGVSGGERKEGEA